MRAQIDGSGSRNHRGRNARVERDKAETFTESTTILVPIKWRIGIRAPGKNEPRGEL
ncbi:MAG: hypothetical protein GF363_16795 [Chitinivibrionales bacterium]|nr:hypothetical protein [Chitinivibrionales bacterium]